MRETTEEERYQLAVEYMALTELYDRFLSSKRSRYDITEAFLYHPIQRRNSNFYDKQLLKDMGIAYKDIRDEIKSRPEWSVQRWIDEYYRMMNSE